MVMDVLQRRERLNLPLTEFPRAASFVVKRALHANVTSSRRSIDAAKADRALSVEIIESESGCQQ